MCTHHDAVGFEGMQRLGDAVRPSQLQQSPPSYPPVLSTGQPELRTPSYLSTAASVRLLKGNLPQTEPVGADLLSPQGIFPGSSPSPMHNIHSVPVQEANPSAEAVIPEGLLTGAPTYKHTHIHTHTSQRAPHSPQRRELLRVTFSSPPAG